MIRSFFDRLLRRRVFRLTTVLDGEESRSDLVSYAEARLGQRDLAASGFTTEIVRM